MEDLIPYAGVIAWCMVVIACCAFVGTIAVACFLATIAKELSEIRCQVRSIASWVRRQ